MDLTIFIFFIFFSGEFRSKTLPRIYIDDTKEGNQI